MSIPKPQFTDDQFLDGLRNGDSVTLAALYKKHYNVVLKFIVNNSGSEEEAQDIYQETIIVLFENVKKPGFVLTCRLQTYIFSVARHLWLKQLKKSGKTFLFKEEEESEIVDTSLEVVDHLAKERDIDRMQKSLFELGEPCASLIKDFYVQKLSMDTIAEKFGYTNADNAKNQKYKCLQRLKRYFFDKTELEKN